MTFLGGATSGATPFSPQKLQAWGTLIAELIIAQVALALGNISVLGVTPFAFLTQWGHDLQQTASDAYTNANAAQATATTANTTAATANTNANSALASITSLISSVTGAVGIGGVGTAINSALTAANSAIGKFTSLIDGVVGGSGNPLTALISSLTGTASTASSANTNANTGLSNWSTLIAGIGGISNITQLVAWFTDLLSILGGPTSMGTGSPAVNTTGRPPLLKGLLDGLFGGFTQNFTAPADQAAVADAATGVASSLTGNAAGLAQLQAALSPGTPDSDDFERSSSSDWTSAQWLTMVDGGGGTVSLDGHNALYTVGFGNDSEMVGRRILNSTAGKTAYASTDNQTVSVVLSSAINYVTDGNAALDLWLRMSAFTTYATRTGVRMRFWGDKTWQLHWFNSGTGTLLTNGTHTKSVSSGTFEFDAGQSLTTRRFIAKINSEPIMDFTELTAGSLVGASYRYRGVGLRGEFSALGYVLLPLQEMQPPGLKQWTGTG